MGIQYSANYILHSPYILHQFEKWNLITQILLEIFHNPNTCVPLKQISILFPTTILKTGNGTNFTEYV